MPANTCRLTCGNAPIACTPSDETDYLIQSITTSAARTKTEYFDDEGCVDGLIMTNPILTLAYSGNPLAKDPTNLSDIHPGTEVGGATAIALANFAAVCFGFTPGTGKCIAEDPSLACTRDTAEGTLDMTITCYPHIA